jgi:hypothetical protein
VSGRHSKHERKGLPTRFSTTRKHGKNHLLQMAQE